MKSYPLVIIALIFFACNAVKPKKSGSNASIDGLYVWNTNTNDDMNDSILIYSDTLTVYKDPGYGFGKIISFTYRMERIDEEKFVLFALTMNPEGMFVLPQQYDWHQDTIQLNLIDKETAILTFSTKEKFKLNKQG